MCSLDHRLNIIHFSSLFFWACCLCSFYLICFYFYSFLIFCGLSLLMFSLNLHFALYSLGEHSLGSENMNLVSVPQFIPTFYFSIAITRSTLFVSLCLRLPISILYFYLQFWLLFFRFSFH